MFKCSMIDAPVSGGVGGAAAGTLTFMVGGSQVDFNRARPVLETMGKNVVHCGGISTGQVCELVFFFFVVCLFSLFCFLFLLRF